MTRIESRQVSWWPVHEFLTALLAQANIAEPLPLAGTPAWQALADGNPVKLLAVAAAGEHHALRMETAQEHHAQAGHAIAAAADWTAIARSIRRHQDAVASGVHIERITA